MKILVSAGPTREFLDPVRFLSNRSTGRMGFAVASAARNRGHEVTLVAGPVSIVPPDGVRVVNVISAADMFSAVRAGLLEGCGAIVMAAAVADWRPAECAVHKLKKSAMPFSLKLVRNPDILAETVDLRSHCVSVGFAAETDNMLQNAASKLADKQLDMIVANDVTQQGAGFETDTNIVSFITALGIRHLPLMSKLEVAEKIVTEIEKMYSRKFGGT